MKQKNVLKAIKARLNYLKTVKGFPASVVTDPRGLVDVFKHDAETIMQFEKCDEPQYDELQRLVVEMCSDLIYMSDTFDSSKTILFSSLCDFEYEPMPRTMPNPKDANVQTYGPGGLEATKKAVQNFGDAVLGVADLPKRSGKVSDGTLKNNEHFKLTYDQKIMIKQISLGDPACINGLTRIIVEFERPDLVHFIRSVGLSGRPRVIGFLAKLCRYDMKRMDAVKNAYESRMITEHDIQTECLENKGRRFSMEYVMDNYGE